MPSHRRRSDSANTTYKVVLLGEGRVGKTSILLRYVEGSFLEGRASTVQASYLDKRVVVEDDDDLRTGRASREAVLSIWDTAGQERYHSLGPIYYRDARGALLVYDVTDRPSFDRVKTWTKELRKMVGDERKICLVVLANKCDLERQRTVNVQEGQRCAELAGGTHLECSAKTGDGVEKAFAHLAKKMMESGSIRGRNSGGASSSSPSRNPSLTGGGLACASSRMSSSSATTSDGGNDGGRVSLTEKEETLGGCC